MHTRWITRKAIESVGAARKPCAYVQRAYIHLKERGEYPAWARHNSRGVWEFDIDFIQSDAKMNSESIGVSVAARLLKTTRRTIQNWIDAGDIPVLSKSRTMGEIRLIDRVRFMEEIEYYRNKLDRMPLVSQERLLMKSKMVGRAKSNKKPKRAAKSSVTPKTSPVEKTALEQQSDSIQKTPDKPKVDLGKLDKKAVKEARAAAQRISDGVFDGFLTRSRARGIYSSIAQKLGLESDAAETILREFLGR